MNDADRDPLPQSQVLSYLTTISTPTRVRRLARIGLQLNAALNGFWASGIVIYATWYWVDHFARGMTFGRVVQASTPALLLLSVVLLCGLPQWLMARHVEAGNQRAAGLTGITVLPNAVALAILAAYFAVCGIVCLADRDNAPLPWILSPLLFLLSLSSILGVLLVMDLSKFLDWIAEQPTAEKPPIPFLQGIRPD